MAMVVVGWSWWSRTFGLAPCLGETFWGFRPHGREGRSYMLRPPRGCGVLYLLSLLAQLEEPGECGTIRERNRCAVAGFLGHLRGLPVLDPLRRVVPEGRAARGRQIDLINSITSHAGVELLLFEALDVGQARLLDAAGEDVELQRDRGAAFGRVPRRRGIRCRQSAWRGDEDRVVNADRRIEAVALRVPGRYVGRGRQASREAVVTRSGTEIG